MPKRRTFTLRIADNPAPRYPTRHAALEANVPALVALIKAGQSIVQSQLNNSTDAAPATASAIEGAANGR